MCLMTNEAYLRSVVVSSLKTVPSFSSFFVVLGFFFSLLLLFFLTVALRFLFVCFCLDNSKVFFRMWYFKVFFYVLFALI